MDSIEYKYDLLYGGGYSIKEYYMESGNPRQMRGASELLNECAADVKRHLKKNGINEDHIFTGGATLSAKVPHDNGKKYAAEAEDIFRNKCRTASAAFVAAPFNDDNDYQEARSRAIYEYECRKASKFTSWKFQDEKDDKHLMKRDNEADCGFEYADSGAPPRCPRCRMRTPHYQCKHNNEEEKLYLCTSCAKRERKSGERKYELRNECDSEYGFEINTLPDIADSNGRIALLYADINNLGREGDKMTSFEMDKTFHSSVGKTVKEAVHTAVRRAMTVEKNNKKSNARFEIVTLGGDDICLLLPGDTALLTAMSIVNEFDNAEEFTKIADIYNTKIDLSISVAACVANDTTPLAYMEGIVSSALEKAKTIAREKERSVVNLSYFEQPSDLFPMTAEDLKEFVCLLEKTSSDDVAVTALRNISEARRELVSKNAINEEFTRGFTLFLDYYLARDITSIHRIKPIMTEIRDKYGSKNPWRDFVTWQNQKLCKGVANIESR